MRLITIIIFFAFLISPCAFPQFSEKPYAESGAAKEVNSVLQVIRNDTMIQVFRKQNKDVLLTHVVRMNNRPYIHPIIAPDGKGVLTEYRPSHHLHQTGLYWGLKLVNGRDFFMNWNENFYRQVSTGIIRSKGQQVKWQAVYDLLDENKNVVLTETHNWTMQDLGKKYYLDLEWKGEAKTDITFGKFYVGGLFVRMPWKKGVEGEVINSMGQKNSREAEAQRAIWADVGVQIEGREDKGHIAILDHPENINFPTAWRVDSQLGLGPSRQILGDWKLDKGLTETFRFRIIVYTGNLDTAEMKREWIRYIK